MIMNLLASFADEDDEDEEEIELDAEVDQLEEEDNSNWLDEYKRGCDWEIYTTELSDMFVGWRFSTLSEYLYQKLGIVLFGLQIEDLKSSKQYTRTLLNPGGRIMLCLVFHVYGTLMLMICVFILYL